MQVLFKTIEKYLVDEDTWVELKMQLNYPRQFSSCCSFEDQFIYVFGGTDASVEIEVLEIK